ncbi:ankyrin repeat domain-containing protein [bacterium]|nr:ankyrin repeat domain-containing protein [bacterium]
MRLLILLLTILTMMACGKHQSTSYGFSNTGNEKQGAKAGTVEELLELAILNGEEKTFTDNLEKLTDINFRLKDGRTFLIQAARNKKALFVYRLLQKGADKILADDFQKTAFDYSVANDDKKTQFLLDENQFPKIQEEMWAALQLLQSSKNVMNAIKAGADPNLFNEQGETALTFLIKNLNFSDKKNKAPMIFEDVIEWKDVLLNLTTTKASLPNSLGETPLSLLETTKKNTTDNKHIEKIDSLIKKLQLALNQETP